MKKTLLLTIICIFNLTVYAQDPIPNFSFENWSVSPALPESWYLYDSARVVSTNSIQRKTGGTHGSYSLRLNSYQSPSLILGADIETAGMLTTTPKSITFDYYNQVEMFSMSGLHLNIYFYDSADNYIKDYSWSPKENNGAPVFTASKYYFAFPAGQTPKRYLLEVKMFNFNVSTNEYCVIDNIKFSNIASGLEEEENGNLRIVYPNPAKDLLGLRNLPANATKAVVISLDGKQNLTQEMASFYDEINISSLPDGLYFIRLEDKNGNAIGSQKFMKNSAQ